MRKGRRERPRGIWTEKLKTTTETGEIKWIEARIMAEDREKWRKICKSIPPKKNGDATPI